MINWIIIVSGNLNSIAYDENTKTLLIRFHGGSVYKYFDVPNDIYEGLLNAPSHGKYHASFIKNNFRYEKISEN